MTIDNFKNWKVESYTKKQLDPNNKYPHVEANWIVDNNSSSVTQTKTCLPSFFYSDFNTFHQTIEVELAIGYKDDDFLGFALNFQPGDTTNPNPDILLVDWMGKERKERPNRMQLSHITYQPDFLQFTRLDYIARAKTLSSKIWENNRVYKFKFFCTETNIKVWVDGSLEFDISGTFTDGRFAYYAGGQRDVTFRNFESSLSPEPQAGEVELSRWAAESYNRKQIGAEDQLEAKWTIAAAQLINGQPTFFYSDFNTFGHIITANLYVETAADDDFVGFALNFQPGDTGNENADFILLHWSAQVKDKRAGLNLCRVHGIPQFLDFLHLPVIEPATNLGSTPWIPRQVYEFKFQCNQTKLQIWVDGSQEFDVEGNFEDGRFACFDSSQAAAVFSKITAQI
ncbi:MAG: hypothetical protein F6K21_30430 [Symploca sp. SIO2D2]|nr:hypothetical protein [Symploca sp. SIO2D2]